ncbi:MAG: alkane 1-monooxygenase [Alteromonadaceae bacterium]|nr:alkane 1-monooxygenase [Alteromonadaceae bacterium]|tara:strand:+ start:1527 stop:2915 length:1389 start_codon:yes stop_codon:yes gene_type:complete
MTTITANETHWSDGKRYLWLFSPLVPFLGLIAISLYLATGWSTLLWMGPVLVYIIIPLADLIVGTDTTNPPETAVSQLENDRYYRAIVFTYIPAQLALTVWGVWLATSGQLSGWEIFGLCFTVGVINGIAINTAHELGHKKSGAERWLAKLTLMPAAYGHFFIEHNKGHHVNVATPDDPASSKMGESFWAFLPRTVVGSARSAWNIEKKRLNRLDKSVWSLENENLQAWGMTLVFFGVLTVWLGWPALVFLVIQAAYGASLLEVVNYLEHYGLLRKKLPSGRYERCQPRHSWNSNHIVTNLFLYQLQRHSDHHAHPTRRFQALRHFEDSPQLPSGYASLLLLAYFPPLWRKVMDPRVVAHHGGDLNQANILPSKRKEILARWGVEDRTGGEVPLVETAEETAAASTEAKAWHCPGCGYVYRQSEGCEAEGFSPGTAFSLIPDDWCCPDCGVRDKVDFKPLRE